MPTSPRRLPTASPTQLPAEAPLREGSGLTARKAVELFEDQLTSRQLDVAARELKKTNRSFYTISSAGHENNVVVGAQLRTNDPAFLHYRSGALMMARARQLPGSTPAFDALLGIVASSRRPDRAGPPQGVGQPPALGPAADLDHRQPPPQGDGPRLQPGAGAPPGVATDLPDDAIVLCSFGDATVNHATARRGSTPPATRCGSASRCRSSSSARTTRRASACRPRRAGSPRASATSSISATTWPTARSTRSTPSPRCPLVRGARRPAFLHLRTCACGGIRERCRAVLSVRGRIAEERGARPLLRDASD